MRYRRKSPIRNILIAAALSAVVTVGILAARISAEIAEERVVYTEVVEAYNASADEYRKLLGISCVDNVTGLPPVPATRNQRETGTREEYLSETEIVRREWEYLRYAIHVVRQITEPSAEEVAECLRTVEGITEIAAVTKERDPNGQLGKEGGYTACVYFSADAVDSTGFPGNDVIGKGTDGGGAVEVYRTSADALARCEYLGQFDNTLLYAGSCAVVGTMVIRTSYALTDEEQWLLTDRITRAFTEEYHP